MIIGCSNRHNLKLETKTVVDSLGKTRIIDIERDSLVRIPRKNK